MANARHISLALILLLSLASLCKCISENGGKYRCNIILLGATGDLAKRYLWRGLFNLYNSVQKRDPKITFRFYGAARMANDEGQPTLENILWTSIKCSEEACESKKAEFINLCSYVRLKAEEDYERLQDALETSLQLDEGEFGRLFYLSVPPFAYEDISKYIHTKCRPKKDHIWTKVVLEKPFGSDLKSAQELSEKLSKYWKENEIYRIDHYLGKDGVRQIMEFRNQNRDVYKKIWNKDFIEQVKIVVKERGDAGGRMGFYDHYGVIRDMFQNHLTEILVLVAAELSENNSEKQLRSKKTELLKSLRIVTLKDAVFGQYEHYNSQLKRERPESKNHSYTPTFSAVLMHVDNSQWSGVPFILVSGKSLDTRVAYVQVQFKRNTFCVSSEFENGHSNCLPKHITFHIQGGKFKHPTVLVSSLPKPVLPHDWETIHLNTSFSKSHGDILLKPPSSSSDAYSSLIQDVFYGDKNMFISGEDLLHSWKVWTPLLEMSSVVKPRLYSSDKMSDLDFEIVKGTMKFVTGKVIGECKETKPVYQNDQDIHNHQHSFRGDKLVSGFVSDVIQNLANDIALAAQIKVHSGEIFHLALSGGSTPKQLFQILAHSMEAFPWEHTHVWIVDERCVSLRHNQSNFNSISESLLRYVRIPFLNVHPMSVDVAGRLCDVEDGSDLLYEQLLKHHVGNTSLDFVVLGVGVDGHTASLFPYKSSLQSSRWVEFTTINATSGSLSRMTLTLPMLNRSKNIGILIAGSNKQGIISKLSTGIVDIESLPVTGVKPMNGLLTWYIDNIALQL